MICSQNKQVAFWPSILAGIIFSLLVAVPGLAQVESGRVVGNVQDPTGAVILGAAVTVKNTVTGIEQHVLTNNNGEFVVTYLPPGTYTVAVEHGGYKRAEQAPFQLNVNQVVSVKITLEVGAVSQVVRVTGAPPLLESQTSSLGQVVGGRTIRDLPLNGRNFIQLTYLTAGVNAGPQGIVQQGNIPENERGNGAVQANGLQATNNNFLLDGFDNNEQQIGMELIQPSVDAIQEFKVQTNGFGADIGKGGAVVNLAIRSGTNEFHGSAFEFVRNSVFDSRNYFDDPTLPVPPYRQNQFGGSLGGPILKNKAFFFIDYQGTRIAQSQTDISTVPPLSERTGNFSDLLTGQTDPATGYDTGQIFDPFSYDPSTGTRQPFPGNIIPKYRLDPAALNVINIFPAPNKPGAANNYLLNPTASNNQDQFDIKVDGVLGAKDNISALFSYGNVNAHAPDPLPGLAGGGVFSGNIANLARFGGISDVHTFSADKINEFKLGYGRYVVSAIQNFAGQAIATQLGIPGINVGNLQDTGGLPNISISNLSPLGNQDYFPEFLRENNYQLIDSFSYLYGKHSIKAGIDIRRRKNGFYQVQNARGDLFFDQQFTDNLSDGVGGSPVASFLLGYPISAFRDGLKSTFGQSWWEVGAYIMDDYRATPKLTLNLGLRYDIYTPYIEDHNRIANFNFTTGEFISPQMPGVSRSGNVRTNFRNFAPRIGFAYTPGSGRTTLRGAYGIFYDLQADQGDTELAYNPTGFYFSQSITNPATTPSLRLSTGFPPIVYPSLQNPFGRASAALFNNATPYIQEWNLNIEQQLTKDMVLQIAYA
ncbi:MAG: carboxypeptidase regulatory-like domain-containing protein, partial [Acidobacteriaceae bacterium]